jgi:transcriptional regulator with XRE-family HTH domain
MTFGESLQRARKQKGMTQAELAEKSTISREAIGNYENDRRTPTIDTARKLGIALGMNYYELIGWRSIDKEGMLLNDAPEDDLTSIKAQLITHFNKLNTLGQQKAVENISDLATHPKYTK